MHPFSIVMLAIVGVSALYGAYKGARRGLFRQVIRSTTVLVSVFISVYLIKLLSNILTKWIGNRTGEEILAMLESRQISVSGFESLIVNLDGDTMCRLLSIPLALIVLPICFILCFLIVKLIMLIPHAIISRVLGFTHRRNNALTRLLGCALGTVQGIIVAAIIIAPVAGLVTEFSTAAEEMHIEATDTENDTTFASFYDENIEPIVNDRVVKAVSRCGGRQFYNTLATVKIDGTKYNMVTTVKDPAIKIAANTDALQGWDWKKPTEENEAAIKNMIDAICESDYTAHLVTNLFAYASHVYEDSSFTADMEPPLSDVVEAAFDTISMIDQSSLREDLTSLTDSYFVLARENVIYAIEHGDTDAITDALIKECVDENGNQTTVIKTVITTLNDNKHTAPLVTTLAKISVSTMAQQMGMGEDMHQMYEEVRGGLFDTLSISKEDKTEEEYKAEVSTSLDTVLKDNGIELDTEIVDGMANYIYDNYDELNLADVGDDAELSEQKMNDIIFSYFDAYMEYVNPGERPEDIVIPDDVVIPDDFEIPGDIELPEDTNLP